MENNNCKQSICLFTVIYYSCNNNCKQSLWRFGVNMFIGRDSEIKDLRSVRELKKASLVVCRGRRRIGKSTLIQEFAKDFSLFVEIQGLPPHSRTDVEAQLENFMQMVCKALKLPNISARNWPHAFDLLASLLKEREVLLFFDEISWMASGSSNFPGYLKIAWDTLFKKNPKLILVLCGSVTSWIDENILNSTDFIGRISSTITLEEIKLSKLEKFWSKKRYSDNEAIKLLSVTGGVPRYLEEINSKKDAYENIKSLCFKKNGVLYGEFEKIFHDIFNRKSLTYEKIVTALQDGPLSAKDISTKLQLSQSGTITHNLKDLCESGFLHQDFTWELRKGIASKLSRFRLKDNYLRFYLKFIRPHKKKIEADLYKSTSSEIPIANLDSVLGLQLENLILNNINDVVELLNINPNHIVNFGSYFQTKTVRRLACQIDFLIQTKSSYYICEIKSGASLSVKVVAEVQEKISKLHLDNKKNIKTVLFYAGELSAPLKTNDYFDFLLGIPSAFWKLS